MMRTARQIAVILAVSLACGGVVRAETGSYLSAMVDALQAMDPAVAAELAFLRGDPSVVAAGIETYVQASTVTRLALDALAVAEDAHFAAMDSYRGRTAAQIGEEIARLDPAAADREATLARLEEARAAAEAHESAVQGLAAQVAEAQGVYGTAQAAEDAALLVLSGGVPLSAEARLALRSLMGF